MIHFSFKTWTWVPGSSSRPDSQRSMVPWSGNLNSRLWKKSAEFILTDKWFGWTHEESLAGLLGGRWTCFRIDAWSKCNLPHLETTVRCHSELCVEHMSGNSDNNPKIIHPPITCHWSLSRSRIHRLSPVHSYRSFCLQRSYWQVIHFCLNYRTSEIRVHKSKL